MPKLLKKISIVSLLLLFILLLACGPKVPQTGVLVIAHGATTASWNLAVEQAVDQADLPYPVEVGFLEFTTPDIQDAVNKLEDQGVKKIIAVPLFVASHSSHMEEIKYMLGLRDTPPPEAEELTQVETEAEIVLTRALDDDPLVAGILGDRVESMCQNPEQEIVVLAGHGDSAEEYLVKLRQTFASLASQIEIVGFKAVVYGFAAMGEPTIRDVVSQAVTEGNVLVQPVMIAEGYWTSTKIPQLLEGLNYKYPEEGERALLPHINIARIIEQRVSEVE